MSEKAIKQKLDRGIKALQAKDLAIFKWSPFGGAYGGQAGMPDRMVIAGGRVIAIECKAREDLQPTSLQALRLYQIADAGGYSLLVNSDASIKQALTLIEGLANKRTEND